MVQLVHDAVEQLRAQADKKSISLSTQVTLDSAGGSDLKVLGNDSQLQRALINILQNAISYTPSGGSVSVSARPLGGEKVELKFQDTGVGIDPSDLPHIFDRFYRADKARTRETGGTGLGLAIVREIVARHHGTVEVDSQVGRGHDFYNSAAAAPGQCWASLVEDFRESV